MLLSLIGHYIGGICYYWGTLHYPADAWGYFYNASPALNRIVGTAFVKYIVWWLRFLFFGELYFGAYSFFIFIGFLGSMFYFLCFRELFLRLQRIYGYAFNIQRLRWGYFLVMCWPASLFWASNLGKDSLAYFSLSLFFLSLVRLNKNKLYILLLLAAALLSFCIRPYLVLVGTMGFFFWHFLERKENANLLVRVVVFFLIAILGAFFAGMIAKFGGFEYSMDSILQKGLHQQQSLAVGTSIPILANDKMLMLIFIPYMMFANMFFPLFFFAKNLVGIIATCQNFLLLTLCYKFIKKKFERSCMKKIPIIGYMFWFFVSGMGLLGMTNTNLGLADREKIMYLMPLLIVILLTLSLRSLAKKS